MKAPISAVVMAFNEEENIKPLMESLKDMDEVIIIDHESTDNTAKLAKDLGAKVFTEPCEGNSPTEDDIREFNRRYHFPASFTTQDFFFNAGQMKNGYFKRIKNDWTLWIDADERLVWDMPKVMELLPLYDAISCRLYLIGAGQEWITCVKLGRNDSTWWSGRVHENLIGADVRYVMTDHMKIEHHQKPKAYRGTYLPRLEYTYLKDQDPLTCFYLAREYLNYNDFKKSMFFFNMMVKGPYLKTWRSLAFMYMARCQIELGDTEKAQKYCMWAIMTNPSSKEPLMLMAQLSLPDEAKTWKKFANLTDWDRTL